LVCSLGPKTPFPPPLWSSIESNFCSLHTSFPPGTLHVVYSPLWITFSPRGPVRLSCPLPPLLEDLRKTPLPGSHAFPVQPPMPPFGSTFGPFQPFVWSSTRTALCSDPSRQSGRTGPFHHWFWVGRETRFNLSSFFL